MNTSGFYSDQKMNPNHSLFISPSRDRNFETFSENRDKGGRGFGHHALMTDRPHANNQNWMSKMNKDYQIPSTGLNISRRLKLPSYTSKNITNAGQVKTKYTPNDKQNKFNNKKRDGMPNMVLEGKKMLTPKHPGGFRLRSSFKSKSKHAFHSTQLGLIKESEDSDEPEEVQVKRKPFLKVIDESENENYERIEKGVSQILDTNEDEHENQPKSESKENEDTKRKFYFIL
jgi:hypothetical protein